MIKPIGPGGHRGAAHAVDQVILARSLARIDHHRQMAHAMQLRHGRQRQRVADVFFVRANAPLAEHHVGVSLGHDVLGGEQKFFQRGAHAALEQHRLALLADRVEQIEVLHVPRPTCSTSA